MAKQQEVFPYSFDMEKVGISTFMTKLIEKGWTIELVITVKTTTGGGGSVLTDASVVASKSKEG